MRHTGRVVASMSMSMDGFIANPDDTVGPLFDWYGNGSERLAWPGMGMVSHVSPVGAAYLRGVLSEIGALVCGRHLFDITQGWGGDHPAHVPVFVVTHRAPDDWGHPEAPFTFVTDGLESAIAQAGAAAGDKVVSIASAGIARQCLAAGLLDEIAVDLIPVMLGRGKRWFEELDGGPVMLDDPKVIVDRRATHLRYRVRHG